VFLPLRSESDLRRLSEKNPCISIISPQEGWSGLDEGNRCPVLQCEKTYTKLL